MHAITEAVMLLKGNPLLRVTLGPKENLVKGKAPN